MLSFHHANQRIVSAAALLALACSVPIATQAQGTFEGTSTLHGKTVVMPRGTTFEGRLSMTISSKSRQGQQFTINTTAPVLANGTDVVVPTGSEVIGEIVEAIPAGDVPHPKGVKPTGKLRVQLSGLRTPDGITYPLVGSLAGETSGRGGGRQQVIDHNNNIAYVGTQAGFEAVSPGANNRNRYGSNGRGPSVVTRRDLMNDPIYGVDRMDQNTEPTKIRSLVKRGRDLYIDGGSPVLVRLDAPFKIGISQAAGASVTLTPQVQMNADGTFGRRFQKGGGSGSAPAQQQNMDGGGAPMAGASIGGAPMGGTPLGGQAMGGAPMNDGTGGQAGLPVANPASSNPLPGILPDIPHTYTPPPQPVQAPPAQAAPASSAPPADNSPPPKPMKAAPEGSL